MGSFVLVGVRRAGGDVLMGPFSQMFIAWLSDIPET